MNPSAQLQARLEVVVRRDYREMTDCASRARRLAEAEVLCEHLEKLSHLGGNRVGDGQGSRKGRVYELR